MYGEMSHASTTQAKLEAQGGIHKAVAVDSAESTIKAATQKGAVAEQAAQLAGGGEDGKKIAEAIKNGSAEGADLLAAGIVRAAQNLGAAQSGARTASDMSQIRETGGKDAFVEAARIEGGKRGVESKVQNIDLLDQEKSQNFVNDIDKNVLQRVSPQERKILVERMKDAGMLTENSTPENLIATSGEKFALAQARLSAGAMNRSERFAIGDTSINAVRDVATGHARIEARRGNVFTDGDEVNHNFGVNFKNPVQYAAHEASLYDTTHAGTDDGSAVDNFGEGATLAVGAIGASKIGYDVADRLTGKKLSSGLDAIKHKVKGHEGGKDANGKTVYFDKDTWNHLEENGMAERGEDGKWKVTEDRKKVESYLSSTQPSSAGAFQKSTAAQNTNPITKQTPKNASADIADSSNINSSEGKNTPFDVSKYNNT